MSAHPGQTSHDSGYDNGSRGPPRGYGSCGWAGHRRSDGWLFSVGRWVTAAQEPRGRAFSGSARAPHRQTTAEPGPDAYAIRRNTPARRGKYGRGPAFPGDGESAVPRYRYFSGCERAVPLGPDFYTRVLYPQRTGARRARWSG